MPAIQQSQLKVANELSQHYKPISGNKRLPQGMVKKKKKMVNFQKTYQQRSTPLPLEPHRKQNSPFTTTQVWIYFLRGQFLNHGKSENGFQISGVN